MNTLLMRFAFVAAAAAPLSSAFAQTDASVPPAPGLTRAQVVAELKQAYLDGELPTNDGNYPPSDATRARNRELAQIAHPAWVAHAASGTQTTSAQQ
ncbi:DUF4148 domain-containing protein [Burkholderia dolosa]|uniref:DUF4148 domain-containing protein n=1 Tax=Burkholderia dolosa TaxID=152500 RepID=UPI001591DE58|nr:DUF4148 domain-containing protein [Burkholderia dolosa]MBY4752481.1 DUF4148 domain-containing protein [Burkholderia dolosa]